MEKTMTSLQAFLSFLLRAPKFPFPLPLLTPATQAIPFINRADKVIRQACEQAHRGALVAGPEKEGELATTSLEFEYLHGNVDAKYWLAEMTFVMTSLPLARVFQCLFTFALVSASRWLAATWQLSRRGATGELEVEFKFHRRRCNLSFFFPPCRHSAPESLLASYPRFNKLTTTKQSLCWDFKISQSKVHTSEVDLELQLMVINFLSLVALTSTIYLQDDINKSWVESRVTKDKIPNRSKFMHFELWKIVYYYYHLTRNFN